MAVIEMFKRVSYKKECRCCQYCNRDVLSWRSLRCLKEYPIKKSVRAVNTAIETCYHGSHSDE